MDSIKKGGPAKGRPLFFVRNQITTLHSDS